MIQSSKRAVRRLAAVLLAPAAALTLAAAPASAETSGYATVSSWQDCPAGWFCAWENADATGHWARFQDGSSDLTKAINGYVFNDKFQYAYNRTNNVWALYENIGYNYYQAGRKLLIGRDWRGPLAPKYDFANLTSSLIWIAN